MQVLLLAWGVGDGPLGPSPQAAGLARALVAAGHDVRVVTRSDPTPPQLAGLEVHTVVDAPPIVPPSLRDPVLDALAFAGRATSVAVRRIEERPVDVVHAEGWMTGPVVTALRTSHAAPVVAAVEPELPAEDTRSSMAAALVAAADVHVARTGTPPRLPVGVDLPGRRPGPPPSRGPVLLSTAPSDDHRVVARRIREALPSSRRITRSWARRPAAVVVLDPQDVDTVVRGLAAGVPVVAADGPAGALVAGAGAGVVVDSGPRAVAAVTRLVTDGDEATARGRAAADAAADHAWGHVVAVWEAHAARAVRRATAPRLQAAR